ncbi:hypothetical protein JL722_1640 [Aureococcus anophagefferens]|nr:hypothetical protein JL722_1640 [Aureococcus anophagefferens]
MSPEECGARVSRAAAVGWKPSPMAPLQMGHRSRFDDAELAARGRRVRVAAPDTSGGDKHTPVGDPNCSLFTCLLYLNDGYEGCETCLLPSPGSAPPPADAADDGWPRVCEARGVAVPPRAGRVLVFEHDILHACPPLRAGEKLVVRVDLCYEDVDLDGKRLPHPFRDSTLAPPPGARAAEAPAGHVLHVSSMSAHGRRAADLGVYAASKVALEALADAARAELRAAKRPYRVSCLSPGLVETDFYVAKAGPHAAGLVYAAAATLAARDVVDAALFLLTAPPHVEVADLLINRPRGGGA